MSEVLLNAIAVRSWFTAERSRLFEYQTANQTLVLSYFQVTEEIYDDSELAAHWAQQAYGVALRAKKSFMGRDVQITGQ